VRHFVNRTVEQDALATLVHDAPAEGVVMVSTIDGTTEVGKSALAVHREHKLREQFPDGEIYLNLWRSELFALMMRDSDTTPRQGGSARDRRERGWTDGWFR
jgi:hypothetical protein